MSDLPRDAYATYIRTRTQTIDPGYGPVSLSQAGILSKQAVSTGTLFHVLNLADVLLFSPRRPELSMGPCPVTQPNPTHYKWKNLDPTEPNTANNGAYSLAVTHFYTQNLSVSGIPVRSVVK